MYWRKEKLTYNILIPPSHTPFCEMNKKEAQAYFDWYVSKIPERIKYLSERCASDLGIDISELDLSPESLIYIWRWFLSVAKIEKTPRKALKEIKDNLKRQGEAKTYIDHVCHQEESQLSLQTEYILRDIGMYLGSVWTKNNPSLYWGFIRKPKRDVFVNEPLIMGFASYKSDPVFRDWYEPINMVGVQAQGLFDNECTEKDIYDMYMKHLDSVHDTVFDSYKEYDENVEYSDRTMLIDERSLSEEKSYLYTFSNLRTKEKYGLIVNGIATDSLPHICIKTLYAVGTFHAVYFLNEDTSGIVHKIDIDSQCLGLFLLRDKYVVAICKRCIIYILIEEKKVVKRIDFDCDIVKHKAALVNFELQFENGKKTELPFIEAQKGFEMLLE